MVSMNTYFRIDAYSLVLGYPLSIFWEEPVKPDSLSPFFNFFLESFGDEPINPNSTYLRYSIDPRYFFSVVLIQASFEYTKKYVCNFLAAFCTAIVIIHRSSVRRQLVLLWDIS